MPARKRDKDGNEILTTREQLFVEGVAQGKTHTQAAIDAGYSERAARTTAAKKVSQGNISAAVQQRIQGVTGATTEETLLLLASHMRADVADFRDCFNDDGTLNLARAKELGVSRLVKKIKSVPVVLRVDGETVVRYQTEIELHDSQNAAKTLFGNLRLQAGEPTAITRHEDAAALADLRAKAEALIAEILPHYGGDRDAALAAVREQAPTLSKYIQ
jgi:hypothetical protein